MFTSQNLSDLKNLILENKMLLAYQISELDNFTIDSSETIDEIKNSNDFNCIDLYQSDKLFVVEYGLVYNFTEQETFNYQDFQKKEFNSIDEALDNFHDLKKSSSTLELNNYAVKKTNSDLENFTIVNDDDMEYIYFDNYIYMLDDEVFYDPSIKMDVYKNVIKFFNDIVNKAPQ